MSIDGTNKGGYSPDKYSTQSREYFDNERRKSAEFWEQQKQNRAKPEQMKADHAKKMQELKNRQAQASSATEKFRPMPKPLTSNRLGGGRNSGVPRGVGGTSRTSSAEKAEAPQPKLSGGIGFWLVAGLFVFKDLFDLILTAVQFVSSGVSSATAATIIGAPVSVIGLTIVAFLIFIGWLISGTVFIVQITYYYMVGVSVGARNLAILALGAAIEVIPVLGLLPAATITFFIIRIMENKKRSASKGLFGKAFNMLSPVKLPSYR